MRTIVQKTACQIVLRNCSKELVGVGVGGGSICVILVKEVHEIGHILAEGCYWSQGQTSLLMIIVIF